MKARYVVWIAAVLLLMSCAGAPVSDRHPSFGHMVTDLRFFEKGYGKLDRSSRIYKNRFSAEEARYIAYELNLDHVVSGSDDFVIHAVYRRSNGEVFCEFEQSVHIKPDWTWSYWWKGWGWMAPGLWKPDTYTVVLSVDGEPIAQEQFEVYDRPIEEYNKDIAANPKSAAAYYNRGMVFRRSDNLERAVQDLTKAIEIDPTYVDAYYARALARGKMKDYKNAAADYSKVVELSPEDPYMLNELAWALATSPEPACRNGAVAVSAALKACELSNWESYNYIDTLAAAYAEVGDWGKAVSFQQKAVELARKYRDTKLVLDEHLELYRQHKPCRKK